MRRATEQCARPLLHGGVLVVAGDPLACWPAQAGLLLQSSILLMVQLLQLRTPSLLTHLHWGKHSGTNVCMQCDVFHTCVRQVHKQVFRT